ncbi:MAG: non-heme chloroperoxidase [Mycobacterium sp.]|jgi:hypothetical protein|nr:non-heme chloroperoxidase [Mycobacterium sp.]
METLDLTNAILVGHSTGGGVIARYIGRYGTARAAKTAFIGATVPVVMQTPGHPGGVPTEFFDDMRSADEFPYSPTGLKRHKDWATSAGPKIDVVAVSDVKAHVLLRNCERVRADGTLIEEVSAFYAFTKTATAGRSSQCPASNSPPPPDRTQNVDTQRSTTAIPPTDAERSHTGGASVISPPPMRCPQVSRDLLPALLLLLADSHFRVIDDIAMTFKSRR